MGPITLANGLVVLSILQSDGLVLIGLQVSTGTVVWHSAPLPAEIQPTVDVRMPFVSLPVYCAGHIIAALNSTRTASDIVAWDVTDGAVTWRRPLGGARPYAGAAADLAVFGNTLVTWYTGNEYSLHIGALDPHTGAQTWAKTVDGGEAVAIAQRIIVITQSMAYTVTGVRPNDGATLWRWNPGTSTLSNDPFGLMELSADDSAILYQRFDRSDSCPSGGLTSIGTPDPENLLSQLGCPQLFAVDAMTGVPLWHRALDLAPIYFATMSFAGNGAFYYQYFTSKQSQSHYFLMALDASGGAVRWKQEVCGLGGANSARDGAIYCMSTGDSSGEGKIIAIDATSGKSLWTSILSGQDLRESGWLVVA
jgi:outer membrane protein assembly factor BamB